MSAAVKRTSGAESEFEKGKIGRGRRDQTEKIKKKTIDTRIWIQNSTSPRAEASPAECTMHAPVHAVVWNSIDSAL